MEGESPALMILRKFISQPAFAVYMKSHCSFKFHLIKTNWSGICTEVSFTSSEVMWTLLMKLSYTDGKLYAEVKSQTNLMMMMMMMMRMIMNCFYGMIDLRKEFNFFFPTGTIVKDSHNRESPTRRQQVLNLRKTWDEALLNEVIQYG